MALRTEQVTLYAQVSKGAISQNGTLNAVIMKNEEEADGREKGKFFQMRKQYVGSHGKAWYCGNWESPGVANQGLVGHMQGRGR